MMFQPFALLGGVAFLSSAVNAAVYNVTLGSSTGNLTFSPNNISDVAAGDVINFLYLGKNHSAVQSSFASPCQPLNGGFKDDFHPSAIGNDTPSFITNFTVNDTKPVWFYCRQTGHCSQGMVFAINAGASGPNDSFDTFLQRARTTANATTNGTTSGNTTTNATSTTTTPGSSSTSQPNGDISLFVPGSAILSGVISLGIFCSLI